MSKSFVKHTKFAVLPIDVSGKLNKQGAIQDKSSEMELWEREYSTLKVIPSSTRTLPSKALLLFSEILGFENMHRVLDAGCGIGRNSIYLAQKECDVYAIDFSETALSQLHKTALKAGVREKIHIYNCSLENPFPFHDNFFDFVVDSYVFCHFTDDSLKQKYRKELYRVTKPGGIVFISLFSVEDGYYRQMLESMNEKDKIIVDPNNGIKKQLYTEREIKNLFSTDFKVLYFVKLEFDDIVLGQTYNRNILVLVLEK